MLTIDVLGEPAPKGSSRAILARGRAVMVPSGSDTNKSKLRSWDAAVRDHAAASVGRRDSPLFCGVPLIVELRFRMRRPGGHWGVNGLRPSAPSLPAFKPDVDKLARATIDSMAGIVFDDDSRIVSLIASKTYAQPGQEGAAIVVRPVAP